jgi:hypothetical protein
LSSLTPEIQRIPETSIYTQAESIPEFGWREPIVVEGSSMIVWGHTKWVAEGSTSSPQEGSREEGEQ